VGGSSPFFINKIRLILENLLIFVLLFPIFGILVLLLIPSRDEKLLKITALNFSCLSFIGSLLVWGFYQSSIGNFQFVTKLFWLPSLNLNFVLGVDGISIFFLLLTTLLIPLCILVSWNSINHNLKEFLIAFLILDFFLIGVFCILDLLLFYIFFESVLIRALLCY
jgi:NADH-quinone oxidoreductase subunit M